MKRLLRKLVSESLFQAQSICGKTTKNLITYDMRVGSSPVLDIFILRWKRPFWWQIYVFRLKGARNIEQREFSRNARCVTQTHETHNARKYGRRLYLYVIVNLITIFSNLSEIIEGRLTSLSYMQKLDKSPVSAVILFLRQKTLSADKPIFHGSHFRLSPVSHRL